MVGRISFLSATWPALALLAGGCGVGGVAAIPLALSGSASGGAGGTQNAPPSIDFNGQFVPLGNGGARVSLAVPPPAQPLDPALLQPGFTFQVRATLRGRHGETTARVSCVVEPADEPCGAAGCPDGAP